MFRLGKRWGAAAHEVIEAQLRADRLEAELREARLERDSAARHDRQVTDRSHELRRLADAELERVIDAERELAEAEGFLLAARRERDEATQELIAANNREHDFLDRLSRFIPESWDGEGAMEPIVEEFVAVLAARLAALGGSSERWQERPDGSVFPDARTDPNGYADAVGEWRRAHSGCRCEAFGVGTPEHAPSVLCKPRPGDRPDITGRCWHGECNGLGSDCEGCDPSRPEWWTPLHETAALAGTYLAAGGATPRGGPIIMDCGQPWGHPPDESCDLSGDQHAWTVHAGRDNKVRTFLDAQHYDTACEDRPHCTIVEHHAVDDGYSVGKAMRVCEACGSNRWVGVRLNGPDSPRRAQCVRCGKVGGRVGDDQ